MQYFPFVVLQTGFYFLFSNPTSTKLSLCTENNPPGNTKKSLILAHKTAFFIKSHHFYADNPHNQEEYDIRLDENGKERLESSILLARAEGLKNISRR